MTKSEHCLFNAYYCRICYCLRYLGGQRARFLTTFDATVYSLILNIARGEQAPPFLPCQRFKKDNMKRFVGDEIGLKIARLSLIALGEKVADDRRDERSIKAAFVGRLLRGPIEKAVAAEPELAATVRDGIAAVDELQDRAAPLEQTLDRYGKMIVDVFGCISPLTDAVKDVYYSLARWTFYIDMLCDYDTDYKNPRAYNGFKTAGCASIADYFDSHYMYVLALNRALCGDLMRALAAADDGFIEWRAAYRVIAHAVATVAPELLRGNDVKYRYFKEQASRLGQEITRRKKSNFR